MGERSQEFAHDVFANLFVSPLLALDRNTFSRIGYNEVNPTIRVCAAAACNGVAKISKHDCDRFFELKPIDASQLRDKIVSLWCLENPWRWSHILRSDVDIQAAERTSLGASGIRTVEQYS